MILYLFSTIYKFLCNNKVVNICFPTSPHQPHKDNKDNLLFSNTAHQGCIEDLTNVFSIQNLQVLNGSKNNSFNVR